MYKRWKSLCLVLESYQHVRSNLNEKFKTKDTRAFDENKSKVRNSKLYHMLSRNRSIHVIIMLSRASESLSSISV